MVVKTKITNERGLPEPFVRMAANDYKIRPDRYSVTTLLKPVREIILSRRHADEMTSDVSDMAWALFGTAAHSILENNSDNGVSEIQIEYQRGKYTISGRVDYTNNETVVDYKTCSVWKFKMGDFSEWERQLGMYAYVLNKCGTTIKNGQIVAILRDHRKGEARREPDYPRPIEVVNFEFDDLSDIEKFIDAKLDAIGRCESLPDDELPVCTPEERWARDGAYGVMRKGRKTALRRLATEEEATAWMAENGGDYIEYREPISTKCVEYCNCRDWCNFYNKIKGEK